MPLVAALAPASTAPKTAPVAAPESAPPTTSAITSAASAKNPFEEPPDFDEPEDLEELDDLDEPPDFEEPDDLAKLLFALLPPDLLLVPDFDAPDLLLLGDPLPALPEELVPFAAEVEDLLAPLLEVDLPAELDFTADDFAAPPFAEEPDLVAALDFEAALSLLLDEPDLLGLVLLATDLLAEPDDFEPDFFDAGILFSPD